MPFPVPSKRRSPPPVDPQAVLRNSIEEYERRFAEDPDFDAGKPWGGGYASGPPVFEQNCEVRDYRKSPPTVSVHRFFAHEGPDGALGVRNKVEERRDGVGNGGPALRNDLTRWL